jgi:molecular chaperone DnaK
VFSTWYDNQDVVAINVFQGEDRDVRHNDPVGGFKLEGLADVKRGNEILVRFDLDLDGILTVTAVEKATGLEENLTIDNAMSRFRSEDHESAKARLDAAFAEADEVEVEQPQQPAIEPDDDLPPEMKQAIAKANELLAQANRLLADANERDAEDMRELMDQLDVAIQARSAEDISDASAKLDDLVFYLQDAT